MIQNDSDGRGHALYHTAYRDNVVKPDNKQNIEFQGNSGARSSYQVSKQILLDIAEPGTASWSIDSSLPAAQGLLQQKVNISPGNIAYFHYPSSYFLLDNNALLDLEKEYGVKLQIDKIGFESFLSQQSDLKAEDVPAGPIFIKAMTRNEDASLQIRCYLNDKKQQDYYVTLVAGNSPSWNAVRPGAPDPDLICHLYLTAE